MWRAVAIIGVIALFLCASVGLGIVGGMLAARSSRSPGRSARDFLMVAKKAESAVVRGDWADLKRVSEQSIDVVQYMRAYDQQFTKQQVAESYAPGLLFAKDLSGVSMCRLACMSIDTRRPLSRSDAGVFARFSKIARESWTTERHQNEIGLRVQAAELPFTGPAVAGTMVSNIHWRIEFGRNTGRWRVDRLVLMMH